MDEERREKPVSIQKRIEESEEIKKMLESKMQFHSFYEEYEKAGMTKKDLHFVKEKLDEMKAFDKKEITKEEYRQKFGLKL